MVKVKKGTAKKRIKRANAAIEKIEDDALAAEAEVRAVGTKAEQAKDSELFFTDKQPTGKEELRTKLSRDEKRNRRGRKVLWSEVALIPNDNIKAIPSEKQFKAAKPSKDGIPKADQKRVKKSIAKETWTQRKKIGPSQSRNSYDVWSVPEEDADVGNWWKLQVKKKNLPLDDKQGASGSQAGDQVAPPGASINPSFSDHQNLLGEAVSQVVRREHERNWVREKLYVGETEHDKATIPQHLAEITPDKAEDGPGSAKTNPEKKTRTERNREMRRKRSEQESELRKAKRKLRGDVERIHEIEKEIEESARPDADKVKKMRREVVRRRIAGRKVPDREITVPLTEELGKDLRRAKVKGNLVRDRFVSLQRRGFAITARKRTGQLK
uniref:Ribosome biogenesis protein NOP53 n=1 Tax=Rhodosorus marinus TaxID=101924 RepID=A0A7S3A4U0_9RHOD|mmetsp:Transcript_44843/g.174028  ORF Transcript_44843/g.174028 Transcript_44843/m.174028 type:complete len:383 (+) Transcript_44843:190-1338(+)